MAIEYKSVKYTNEYWYMGSITPKSLTAKNNRLPSSDTCWYYERALSIYIYVSLAITYLSLISIDFDLDADNTWIAVSSARMFSELLNMSNILVSMSWRAFWFAADYITKCYFWLSNSGFYLLTNKAKSWEERPS